MPIDGLKWGDPPDSAGGQSVSCSDGSAPEPSSRSDHVELVRKAVASGEYHVDSLEIADRLIEYGVLDERSSG